MARRGRLCHASLVRCAQNLRRHIPCRRGGGRSSTKAGLGAAYPTGHRPCGGRTYRASTGCCRSHGRLRSVPPDRPEGICLSIETVTAAKPWRMIPRPAALRKLSMSWGREQRRATEYPGCGRCSLFERDAPFTCQSQAGEIINWSVF
jgi:hypothetical protein